jgi:hypothetical protein
MGVDMIALFDSIPNISTKHRKTLSAVFAKPTLASLVFADIESLLVALGGVVHEREGSRVKMSNGAAIARIQAKRPSGIKWKKYASC